MYPPPPPGKELIDSRSGSATVPLIALAAIFVLILLYLAVQVNNGAWHRLFIEELDHAERGFFEVERAVERVGDVV